MSATAALARTGTFHRVHIAEARRAAEVPAFAEDVWLCGLFVGVGRVYFEGKERVVAQDDTGDFRISRECWWSHNISCGVTT